MKNILKLIQEKLPQLFKTDNAALYIIIAILIGIVGSQFLENEDERKRPSKNEKVLRGLLEVYETDMGQLVSTKDALEVTVEELKAQIYVKDDSIQEILEKYRSVKSTTTIVTVTRVDTVFIPFDKPIEGDFTRKWSKVHEWYQIGGEVSQNGLKIDSLKMWNTQRLVIGETGNFWNTTFSASVVNSNPHIETVDMTTQIIKHRKKRFGLGLFGGVDFRGKLTGGAGINFNFLEF